MHRWCVLLIWLIFASSADATIPNNLGWYSMPGTNYHSVCPTPMPVGVSDCQGVTEDFAGGVYDSTRNRLTFLGGGHSAYSGNEIYALDLTGAESILRLNNPTVASSVCSTGGSVTPQCSIAGQYLDGRPSPRHTYMQLAYVPTQDYIVMISGATYANGNTPRDAWIWQPSLVGASNEWKKIRADTDGIGPSTTSGAYGRCTLYDTRNDRVYVRDDFDLWMLVPQPAGTAAPWPWVKRNSSGSGDTNENMCLYDPKRQRFVIMFDNSTNLYWYDISSTSASTNRQTDATSASCATAMGGQRGGWEYDPVQDKYIIWPAGNTIWMMTPDLPHTCTSVTYSGAPAQSPQGTFGRFRYVPKLNLFVHCFDYNANCSALRLTDASQSALSDYLMNRCYRPGVKVCRGFDSAAEVPTGVGNATGLYPGEDGIVHGVRDTSIAASGSSLKFPIESGTGANSAGMFLEKWPYEFQPGETLYIQWRQRFDTNMVNLGSAFGGGGWKQAIFYHSTDFSCTNLSIVVNNQGYRGFPYWYTKCGSGVSEWSGPDGVILEFSNPYPPGSDGTIYCRYNLPFVPPNKCFFYHANEWMTFYLVATLGAFNTPTSTIKLYAGYQGQPLQLVSYRVNWTMEPNANPAHGWDQSELTPYDTGKDGRAHAQANTWYDEFLVSTSPIAEPGGGTAPSGGDVTPPSAPTNLRVVSSTFNRIALAWDASTDDTAVTGYLVERVSGGVCAGFSQIGTTASLSYSDIGIPTNTSYCYRVRATDAANNLSGYSTNVSQSTDTVKFHPTLNLRRISYGYLSQEGSYEDPTRYHFLARMF